MPASSKKSGAIRHLRRRVGVQNTVFQAFLDTVEGADGFRIQDYLVVAPYQLRRDFIGGVAVLPVVGDRCALLEVFRHPIRRWTLEIPRGFLEAGESARCSAARELLEETGFPVKPKQLIDLGFVAPDSGVLGYRLHLFAALCQKTKTTFKPVEIGHKRLRLFSRGVLKKKLESGAIEDPYTMAALVRFLAKRR